MQIGYIIIEKKILTFPLKPIILFKIMVGKIIWQVLEVRCPSPLQVQMDSSLDPNTLSSRMITHSHKNARGACVPPLVLGSTPYMSVCLLRCTSIYAPMLGAWPRAIPSAWTQVLYQNPCFLGAGFGLPYPISCSLNVFVF